MVTPQPAPGLAAELAERLAAEIHEALPIGRLREVVVRLAEHAIEGPPRSANTAAATLARFLLLPAQLTGRVGIAQTEVLHIRQVVFADRPDGDLALPQRGGQVAIEAAREAVAPPGQNGNGHAEETDSDEIAQRMRGRDSA